MKKYVLKFGSLFILVWMVSYTALAQFDDIYFDPDTDQAYVESYTREGGDTYVTENYYYDDEDYDYYDRNDQDFYYSSRIRRFSRPMMYSAGFYDPFFFDPFYYGGSGLFLSFGSRYNSWNRWNRFNRFNNYAFGYGNFYDPFFYGGRGFNAFDPYFGYCPPTFFNRGYGYGGYGNNFYNTNNYYGSAYENYQPVFSNNGSYYGARRGGSVSASPSTPVKSPRSAGTLTTTEGNRTITNAVRSGDVQRNAVVERKTFRTTENAVNNNRVTKTYTPTTTTRTAPRETYRAVPNNSTRSVSPTRTESTRTYSPSPSSSRNRSYSPSSTSPSKSYAPSRSASPSRSYTPSRTSTPSRSYTPDKSGSSSSPRSYSPSSSSTPRSSGSSGSSSRSSSPRRN